VRSGGWLARAWESGRYKLSRSMIFVVEIHSGVNVRTGRGLQCSILG